LVRHKKSVHVENKERKGYVMQTARKSKPLEHLKTSSVRRKAFDIAEKFKEDISASPVLRKQALKRMKRSHGDILDSDLQKLTKKDVIELIGDICINDNQANKFCTFLRDKFGGKSVEPNIKTALIQRKKLFDHLLVCEEVIMIDKDGNPVMTDIIYTNSVQDTLELVANERGFDMENIECSISLDDGKGSLKVILNCHDPTEEPMKNKKKDTGAHRSIVLAYAANTPEKYENIAVLLSKINLEDFVKEFNVIADLKMLNILAGITTGASRYPCVWGTCRKENGTWIKGNNRTFSSLLHYQGRWKEETEGDRKKLKEFYNSEYEPLIEPVTGGDTEVLDVMIILGLHVLRLGPFNKLYDLLVKYVELKEFEKDLYLVRERYHSKTFEGNEIKRIYRRIEQLEEVVMSQDETKVDIVECMKELEKVDKLAAAEYLDKNYRQVIETFKSSWMNLHYKYFDKKGKRELTIPNKVHVIVDHLPDYFDRTGKTLHNISDQTIESVHQLLFKHMVRSNYYVKHAKSKKHSQKALAGLKAFNSYNVGFINKN
jgi:hypothetical protein